MDDVASAVRFWLDGLQDRYAADLTFSELRRGVQALSSRYVERLARLPRGGALDGAGKRAAFAAFYAPLHLHTVQLIVRSLGAHAPAPGRITDLGCGTGAAAAGWALCCEPQPRLLGFDLHPWAVQETRWNWKRLGLSGSTRRSDIGGLRPTWSRGDAIVAGWLVGELKPDSRDALRTTLLDAARRRARVLVVEPIARRGRGWWDAWSRDFAAVGGRSDTWRFRWNPPARLRELDRAAGLDHAELTARTLSV